MKPIVALLMLGTLILSCASAEPSENKTKNDPIQSNLEENTTAETGNPILKDISAEEFQALLTDKPGTLLDVRTVNEFEGGAISGALNIDFYATDFLTQLDDLDKNIPVYVYCKSGGRSGKTAQMLVEKGFLEVYNLIGGYSAWPY